MPEPGQSAVKNRAWLTEPRWRATCQALYQEKSLSAAQLEHLEAKLPEQIETLSYLATHMGVHASMSVIRYAIPIPMPGIGGLMRLCWTAGHRVTFTLRRRFRKAQVHSLPVMALAMIPFAGIFAYLYEVKRLDPQLVYLACEHVCRERKQQTLRQTLSAWPALPRRYAYKFLGIS